MFRNNYHPAFVIGLLSFVIGIFFLSVSGFIYKEFVDEYPFSNLNTNSSSPTQSIWLFFAAFMTTGFIFMTSSIGVMRQNKTARNIVVFLCISYLIASIILYSFAIIEVRKMTAEVILFSGFILFTLTIFSSMILILTGNDAREYFGESRIDVHEDLLDNEVV